MSLRQDFETGVCDLLQSTVAPDSWRSMGGTVGSIRAFNGILVVTQTPENQYAIHQLLAQLRAVHW
jgi:hypothetical protein